MRRITLWFRTACVAVLTLMSSCGLSVGIRHVEVTSGNGSHRDNFVVLSTFQKADIVLGQTSLTTSDSYFAGPPRPADASSFSNPWGNPFVYLGQLFVPGYGDNRVLIFNSVPTSNNAAADLVLGQAGFATTTSGTAANQMFTPETVVAAEGKLFVADSDNNRILIWNTIPATNQAPADVVVGWPDFSTPSSGCAGDKLGQFGEGVFTVANGKLIVADPANDRVLIWNSIPTTDGASADLVLGQPDLTTCTTHAASSATFDYPSGIWADANRLIVADSNNNRILIWSTFPATDNAPADVVLGQTSMSGISGGTSSTKMSFPFFLTSNGNQIFVSDCGNSRVLVWDQIPTVSNAPADKVLGQSNFSNNVDYDDDQDGSQDGAPTARTLGCVGGFYVGDNRLFVMDPSQRRVLIFNGQ